MATLIRRLLRRCGWVLVRADRYDGLRDERDLFADLATDPAHLLNQLLDVRGVEPLREWMWGTDELPARIVIPADLSRKVFG